MKPCSVCGKVSHAPTYEELRAENKRLTNEVQRALEEPTQNEHDLYAECERLRADKARLSRIGDNLINERDTLRAENERLNLELQRHQVTGDYEMGQHHANAALQARVERLRTGWDTAEEQIKVMSGELGAAMADNERLRQNLKDMRLILEAEAERMKREIKKMKGTS